jgi:hypothetical protein
MSDIVTNRRARELFERMLSFVRRLAPENEADAGSKSLVTSVVVQTVDEDFRPAGEAFVAVTRRISTSHLALVHDQPVKGQFLAVQLPNTGGTAMHPVMRVERCKPLGDYFEIAGDLVGRLNAEPPDNNSELSGADPAAGNFDQEVARQTEQIDQIKQRLDATVRIVQFIQTRLESVGQFADRLDDLERHVYGR